MVEGVGDRVCHGGSLRGVEGQGGAVLLPLEALQVEGSLRSVTVVSVHVTAPGEADEVEDDQKTSHDRTPALLAGSGTSDRPIIGSRSNRPTSRCCIDSKFSWKGTEGTRQDGGDQTGPQDSGHDLLWWKCYHFPISRHLILR